MPSSAIAADDNPGIWLAFSVSDSLQSGGKETRWHYWLDAQARFFDPGSGVSQWVLRPGIGYEIGENAKAWLGYARFNTRDRGGTVADENRYWQQIDWAAGDWKGGKVSMRARLEQRSVTISDDVAVVLRFQTKYVRPVGKGSGNSFIIAIEPILDLRHTDWTGEPGLTQNRTFIGLGWRLSRSVFLEAGYMNQYIWVDGSENRSFHHAAVSFNVRP